MLLCSEALDAVIYLVERRLRIFDDAFIAAIVNGQPQYIANLAAGIAMIYR